MSVILYGMDTDNPPYWYGWTVTGLGRATGFVDPDYRQDFFDELALSRTRIDVRPPDLQPPGASYTSVYAYETTIGQGWHAYGSPAMPEWSYSGTNPAMSLFVCCSSPLMLQPAPVVIGGGVIADTPNTAWDVNIGEDAGSAFYVFARNTSSAALTVEWQPHQTNPGSREALTKIDALAIGSTELGVYRLLNPTPTISGNSFLLTSGSQEQWIAAFYLTGVDQTHPNGAVTFATGTSSASAISVPQPGGTVVLNAAGWFADNQSGMAAPTPGGGQTQTVASFVDRPFGQPDGEVGGGYGSANPTWTFSSSQTWEAVAVAVNGA